VGVHLDGSWNGSGSRLEGIEGPSGRRQRTGAERARIAAESLLLGMRVADIARKHCTTRWQIYNWRNTAFKSPFWSLRGLFLSRSTAAVSIAAINSIGNLGGFVGPYVIGYIKRATGSTYGGLVFLAVLLAVSFLMTWFARMRNESSGNPVAA
jgi:transposase-like protein